MHRGHIKILLLLGATMLWIAHKDAHLQRLSLHGGRKNLTRATEVLGRFTRYCDPVDAWDVDQKMLETYFSRRKQDISRKTKKPISPATLNAELRYLKPCLQALGKDRHAPDDWELPTLRRFRELRRIPRGVGANLLTQVLDSCRFARTPKLRGCSAEQWWQTFYVVGYVTGLRCEAMREVPRPHAEQLAARELWLPAELDKADSDRVMYLTDQAVQMIERLPGVAGERLFSWPHSVRYFYRTLHAFQDAAGIPLASHVLPHDLRRTKATNMVAAGVSLPLVQREMGHSTPVLTEKYYVGALSVQQRAAVNSLPVPIVTSGRKRQLVLF